jgi:hypothetical protein
MSNSPGNPPHAQPPDGADAHSTGAQTLAGDQQRRARGRRGDDGSREQSLVPRAEFRSYYGRPVLKPPVWEWKVPAYLFTGGLTAGSALLDAGADLTARPALRRVSRINSLITLLVSAYLLIADLGRRSCVVRSGGRLDPFPWSDQIATASSVKAATTRSVVGSLTPSS